MHMNDADGILFNLQQQILNPIITLIALAAFVYFLWGLVMFIRGGVEGGKMKDEGKQHMLWGIVGLAIIFGARAILSLLVGFVDLF